MREILLTQGKIALVDDEDFDRVNQYKWYAQKHPANGRWYARRNESIAGTRTSLQMHRVIMGLEYGDPRQVDHKDRENTLDNRRQNLRVTLGQNPQNQGLHKDNTSGFKGVTWSKHAKRWQSQIRANDKEIFLGRFPADAPELAAMAYDEAALSRFGEFAVTNATLGLLKKPAQSVLTLAA